MYLPTVNSSRPPGSHRRSAIDRLRRRRRHGRDHRRVRLAHHRFSLKLLRNPGIAPSATQPWPVEVLDKRHGALGVQVADFYNDGRSDYLVSFAQEFETVELYRNAGHGEYEKQLLFQLTDPSYNSSSTTLADINADGRWISSTPTAIPWMRFCPKPYHGVRWLENKPITLASS